MTEYASLIGQIYDCAANPALWPETLATIRDHFNAAYVLTKIANHSSPRTGDAPLDIVRFTPWDPQWFVKLGPIMHKMVGHERSMAMDIDEAWLYSEQASPEVIQRSEFENEWVRPQGLADCIKFNYVKRDNLYGIVSVTTHKARGMFSADEGVRVAMLAPHLRRAMMINEMVDKSNLALTLFRNVLDDLATPVFILSTGRRIVFCNAAAEVELQNANLLVAINGALCTRRNNGTAQAFNAATEQAAKGHVALSIRGIGVPLLGEDGDRAAAYVLPIGGNDLRGALGNGHVALFLAKRGDQQPMTIEVLRTLYDLTPSEARIACLVAKGDGLQAMAETLDLSVNTIRTHLARCFAKTGSRDQAALGAAVNALAPQISPVR